jgi:ATP-dependent DNA helicase RecQ
VNQKYKMEHITNILIGNNNAAVKSFRHNELEIFGMGRDHDSHFWHAIFRQAMIAGLINKDIENYGLLKLTEEGQKFLDNPGSFMMTRNHDYEAAEAEAAAAAPPGGAGDPELFSMLKDLRKKVAKRLNLPPFVIFQDPSLSDMSIQYPISLQELQNIQGVGQGKATRYGKEFVELIKKYVEEKGIERAQDMVVKSIAIKSKNKVQIIQNIDRKVSFDIIAESLGLSMDELLNELESIVNSGTKLNIDYYLEEMMDEETVEDIYTYFKEESETGTIEEATGELGEEDFSVEDIRLVRIKFISELGN